MTSASLTARAPAALPLVVTVSRCLIVIAVASGLAVALWGGDLSPLAISLVGAVVTGIAEGTRAAVIGRRRPVLSDAALRVDTRLRLFATEAVARLQLAAASLTLGWSIAFQYTTTDAARRLVVLALTSTSLVVAVVSLRQAAPRPPRRWTPAAL